MPICRWTHRDGAAILPVRIGMGLNTGAAVVGNVGSPERFDYSVLGDVVNVAARFEEFDENLRRRHHHWRGDGERRAGFRAPRNRNGGAARERPA